VELFDAFLFESGSGCSAYKQAENPWLKPQAAAAGSVMIETLWEAGFNRKRTAFMTAYRATKESL
jgi:hypothetical protein